MPIGDAAHSAKHKHGIQSGTQTASGTYLMAKAVSTESKEIAAVSVPFRGHMKLTFVDGTELQLERGQYESVPKVGDSWPPKKAAVSDANKAAEVQKHLEAGKSHADATKAVEAGELAE